MGTKGQLLLLLEQARAAGGLLSGEEAAARLGVSRAAVWKAVKALRGQGLPIEAVPGGGYRLAAGADVLTEGAIRAHCGGETPAVQVLEETASTNLAAKKWALEGAPHGSMVVALRQNGGRGRLGRSFASPPGGLYLSLVLRPSRLPGAAGLVTASVAVAVCRAVEAQCGLHLGIKWVNDLYWQGKKVCGILTEAATGAETGEIDYLVAGIGVNYTTPPEAFPPEVAQVATSLFPGGQPPVSRAALAAAIRRQVLALFATLPNTAFLGEYRSRSTVLGRLVTVMTEPPYSALAVDIDEEARLVLERPDGGRTALGYGEISVRL